MAGKKRTGHLCGTSEAADITGYSRRHIALMAQRGEIWSQKMGTHFLMVDADEVARVAKERDLLRASGQLSGKPRGAKSA